MRLIFSFHVHESEQATVQSQHTEYRYPMPLGEATMFKRDDGHLLTAINTAWKDHAGR